MIGWLRARFRDAIASPVRGLFHGRMFLQADSTTDLSRVLGTFCVLSFLAYQGYATVGLNQNFDPSSFGTGCAALLAGAGSFVLLHDKATH